MLTKNQKLNFINEIANHIWVNCGLVMLLLMSGSFWAQAIQVPIVEQSGNTSLIPISKYYGYSYGQQLVYPSKINASRAIAFISVYYDYEAYTNCINSDVYLGHMSQISFVNVSAGPNVYVSIYDKSEGGGIYALSHSSKFKVKKYCMATGTLRKALSTPEMPAHIQLQQSMLNI